MSLWWTDRTSRAKQTKIIAIGQRIVPKNHVDVSTTSRITSRIAIPLSSTTRALYNGRDARVS
jgi:hypothetical protein